MHKNCQINFAKKHWQLYFLELIYEYTFIYSYIIKKEKVNGRKRFSM